MFDRGLAPVKIAGPTTNRLRIIVLGGCEEVGRNCTLLEYGDDIIVIDMGLQFPEEDMPGIDYIIPNMSYLQGKERHIRGLIITHGHYDHIGAIPHTVPMIGNPPIFALPMSAAIIRKRQTDFQTTPLNIKTVKTDDTLTLGVFRISFFSINHNIPDAVGIVIETPVGTIVHTGDWKFDFHPIGEAPADFQRMAKVGSHGVLVLMGDSTNAHISGHQFSERDVTETLERIIAHAPGRIIAGTFASLLARVRQLVELAEKYGRKVAVDGYSMRTNFEIAKELGYIKAHPSTLIPIEKVEDYPPGKVLVICTGAQGEERAALMRIANDEHRSIRLRPDDTVIFSSSIVPGNERTVQRLKDTLYRKAGKIYHYQMMDVHAGGHGLKEDIKLMLLLFKPKYYIPIEGNHFMLRENAEVAYSLGWKKEQVFIPDNGQIMEFGKGEGVLTRERVPSEHVFVDGLGVGDVSHVVLRDRKLLAEDGMIVIIVQMEQKTGELVGSPDIVSRGFIYMREQKELVEETRRRVRKILTDRDPKSGTDVDEVRRKVRDEIGQFLFQKTERRPMILPVVIEV